MRAAVYHGTRDIRIEEIGVPEPGSGELLLEVHAAGICGTDAAEWDHGPMMFPVSEPHRWSGHGGPMVPGHEFGGRVVDRGPGVEGFPDGTLVASGAGVSCGSCGPCRAVITNFCERYFTVGLQRHGRWPGTWLFRPAFAWTWASWDSAMIGQRWFSPCRSPCTPSGRAGRVPATRWWRSASAGWAPSSSTRLCARGLRVLAADLDPQRLRIAEALGAHRTLAVDRAEPLAMQVTDTLGGPATVVYEVTGVTSVLVAALEVVEPRGRVVAIGLRTEPVPVDVRSLTLRELRLVGTNAHVFAADFADAARLVASRPEGWSDVAPAALPLELLVTEGLEPMVERRPPAHQDPYRSLGRCTRSVAGNDLR